MDKFEMLRRQVLRSLFSKVDPEFDVPLLLDQPVVAPTNGHSDVYSAVMEALDKVKGIPVPKTTYCSWPFFVQLLLAGDSTITGGRFLSKSSWQFELDGCIEVYVSEIMPVDDKAFQFKKNTY
jgi:hypothetical protein